MGHGFDSGFTFPLYMTPSRAWGGFYFPSNNIFYGGRATGVSADGSIIVGYLYDNESLSPTYPAIWGPNGSFRFIMDKSSIANGISADGHVIFGRTGGRYDPIGEAFRWTEQSGTIEVGDLPGGDVKSEALGASADGSVIVGWGTSALGSEAFIWDTSHGIRNLKQVLVENLGLNLTGWTLSNAVGVSADGLSITGNGIDPQGRTQAWIARLPEPSTLWLFGVASAVGSVWAIPKPRILSP